MIATVQTVDSNPHAQGFNTAGTAALDDREAYAWDGFDVLVILGHLALNRADWHCGPSGSRGDGGRRMGNSHSNFHTATRAPAGT